MDFIVSPLPAETKGVVTFGSFQTMAKINDEVLATWARVLAAIPNARLRVQNKHVGIAASRELFSQRLLKAGIDLSRVDLFDQAERDVYLAAHSQVDILLDTFPYPGGTTTCEALWMGVPTLTLLGNSMMARQGGSLLSAAGLANWVANSLDDYVAKAVKFATDISGLAVLRDGLRAQVSFSPLFDGPIFARNIEKALWGMWNSRRKPSHSKPIVKRAKGTRR
jgi:predicted O-linked N-acetylglucosamine transferase (SPINDLY family)